MAKWSLGDVSSSATLTDSDHLYPLMINELRDANPLTVVVGPSGTNAHFTDIATAIAEISSTGGTVHIKAGTYTISSTISLYSNMTIEGEGIGNTIIKQGSGVNDNVFAISNKSKICIRNLSIDGNQTNNASGDNGILIDGGSNILIDNVESYENKLKGFVISSDSAATTDVVYRGCIARNNGQDGITMASGTTYLCQRITIVNCYSYSNTQYGIGLVMPGTSYLNTYGIIIQGNRIYDNHTYGLEVTGSVGGVIAGNIIMNNYYHGIDVGNLTNIAYKTTRMSIYGNIVKNNSQVGAATYVGINLQYTDRCMVFGNECFDDQGSPTQKFGISVNTTVGNKVFNNMLYGNTNSNTIDGNGNVAVTTNADTTPSVVDVVDGGALVVTNSGSTTITNFDDAYQGQKVTFIFTDSNTTIADSGNFALASGFTSTANDCLNLVYYGTTWYEMGRSAN